MQSNGASPCVAQEGPSGLQSAKSAKSSADYRLHQTLKIGIIEAKDLPSRYSGPFQVSVSIDRVEAVRSALAARTAHTNPYFGDNFPFEIAPTFRQLTVIVRDSGARTARSFGRLSFRKSDIINMVGTPTWFPLKPYSSQSDVTGKICVDVKHDVEDNSVEITVLDYQDLRLDGSRIELYALITPHIDGKRFIPQRLKLPVRKTSTPLSSNCNSESSTSSSNCLVSDPPSIKISLNPLDSPPKLPRNSRAPPSPPPHKPYLKICIWHDMLKGFQSYFHGEVKINLDSQKHAPWYYLKPRNSDSRKEELGSLKLSLNYCADHILPFNMYADLMKLIEQSVPRGPNYDFSDKFLPIQVLEFCHSDELEHICIHLMKILLYTDKLRPMIRAMASVEIKSNQDENALFRKSSFTSKLVSELMKFVGLQYLSSTLKSCLDKIYAEQLDCEIDPSKLKDGADLGKNMSNLIIYSEQVFSRVVDSNHRCPQLIKDVLSDLREITRISRPNRVNVQRLVLNNFIILRFFAAAMANPKGFNLKRENPSQCVQRTTTMISKILTRLSNFVVNESLNDRLLLTKETWLSPVISHFTKEGHKLSMTKFLDRISCVGGENSISGESVTVIKDGYLTQRFQRQKKCFELSWLTTRRRYCCLTETELYWAKSKTDAILGRVSVGDVSAELANESLFKSKNVVEIRTSQNTVYLNASDLIECNEWLDAINRQCRRQAQATQADRYHYDPIDIERQLEALHMYICHHANTLNQWKLALANNSWDAHNCIPASYLQDDNCRTLFANSLDLLLHCAFNLERVHKFVIREALSKMEYGSRDLPIGDDNYLLLKRRGEPDGFFAGLAATPPASPGH